MKQQSVQALEAMLLAVVLACGVLFAARKQRITFRYAIGWLTLFGFMALGGLAIPMIEQISEVFKVSPAALISAISLFLLLTLCVQLSISISGLQRQVRKLNEDLALQKREIDDLRDSQ